MSSSTGQNPRNHLGTPSGSSVTQSPSRLTTTETTYANEASEHAPAPGVRYDYVEAGPSQAGELTPQRRQERLEELIYVFATIFAGLSPEQRARYTPEDTE